MGRELDIRYGPTRAGDIHLSLGDAEKCRQRLGVSTQVSLGRGMIKTVSHMSTEISRVGEWTLILVFRLTHLVTAKHGVAID